jgi:geranylgeranyl transferase type-2 subunit alpha
LVLELELIQRALYADSNDQSLWFYHQFLISSFDPNYIDGSIAPNLSSDERLEYVSQEYDKVLEMLDGADDCKWIYQSLIQILMLHKTLNTKCPASMDQIKHWVYELQRLDPLRKGRWLDVEKDLEVR